MLDFFYDQTYYNIEIVMRKNFTTFYIVRHGETEFNTKQILSGHSDSPLTQNGINQAKEAANRLKDIHFDDVFSSDLLRARRTAEIITLEKKLAVKVTQVLRERNFGDYEGKPYSALKIFNDLIDKLEDAETKKYKASEKFESDDEVASRFITFIREAALTHPRKTILVVCHGGMMRVLLLHLGFATYKELRFGLVENTAHIKLLSDGVEFEIKETHGIKI